MEQLPYTLVETAVNALRFCITTRAHTDANRGPVICCAPSVSIKQHGIINTALNMRALYNDVIDDAMTTVAAITLTRNRLNINFPFVDSTTFKYTAQQYTVALQKLLAALPGNSERKE